MSNIAVYLFALLLVAGVCGCNQGTAPDHPPISTIPPGVGEDEYGYTINGQAFDSKMLDIKFGSVSLSPYSGQKAGAVMMSIYLFYDFNNGSFGSVSLSIPLIDTKPQTMAISNSASGQGVHATALIDVDSSGPALFSSLPGGTITIDKIDKVNNLVSGTFALTGSRKPTQVNPKEIATVTSGYFNDIPIGDGSYNQGNVTALVNGVQFNEDNSGFEAIRATAIGGSLNLEAIGEGIVKKRYIYISNTPLGIGAYFLNDTVHAPVIEYHDDTKPGESGLALSQSPGSGGQIAITMCDTVHRRISGVFVFSGPDSTGHIVNIAAGEINNVQYVQE